MGGPGGAGPGFVLHVDPSDFSSSGHGSIHGPIWNEHDTLAFPGPHWNDFPVVVLGWWLGAVVVLTEGGSRSATVPFMDGPYKVHLFAKHRETWQAERVKWWVDGAAVIDQFDFAPEPLIRSLIVCADKLLLACAANGWKSADVDSVISLRERLIRVGSRTHGTG